MTERDDYRSMEEFIAETKAVVDDVREKCLDAERALIKRWGTTAALLRASRDLLAHSSAPGCPACVLEMEIDAHLREIGCGR